MSSGPPHSRSEPPLAPGADEARDALRGELRDPAYQDTDVIGRVLEWVGRQLDRATGAASSAPPLVTLAAMLLLVGLLLGVAWLVSRARGGGRSERRTAVVTAGELVRADDLATRARAGLAADDLRTALVEGYRAVAVRAVERQLLADLPGATAREVALTLAASLPDRATDVHAAAAAFDAALYGDRTPGRDLVERVLDLDHAVGRARPATGLRVAVPAGERPS